MAFEEYDDFEQEQIVKDWIKNNWLTIALGIGLGLGGVFGLNFYKSSQQEKRYEVANQYKQFTNVMELSEFDEAKTLIADLEKQNGTNFYTIEARLLLAKEYVAKNELEKAAAELNSVITAKPDKLLTEFVKLRLARVQNALSKHDEALALVNSVTTESFQSIAKEIEGDALVAKGEYEKAQTAFEASIANGDGYSSKKNIEMKIENI
ncbi:MAG: YfgM family protein [Marinicellaceae bacterium]